MRVVTGFSGVSQNAAFKLANRVVNAVGVSKGPVRTYVLGQASVYATFQHVTESDLRSAESIGLPIVLVILLALFGAVVAAVLPLVLGIVSVVIALAIVRVIASAYRDLDLRRVDGVDDRSRRRGRLLAVRARALPRGARRGRCA